jgi:diacylglycerol kinase (ATP)
MKVVLIYNRSAGQRDVQSELDDVFGYLTGHGWEMTLHETQAAGHAIELAREAAQQGADMVVAVGGDGTIGEVASGLVGEQTTMGVLPVGTGNLWAHMLGLPVWSPVYPSALMDAARVLVRGKRRAIDVGKVGDRYFLLWCGIGFDAQVARDVEPHRDIRRTLGNLTYVVTGVAQALALRGTRMTIVVDGHARRARVLLILVSNAQLYGPSLRVSPEAQLDDGLLDVSIFRGQNFLDVARHFVLLVAGRQETSSRIEMLRGKSIQVLGEKPLAVHLDGDPAGNTPISIQVLHHAIELVVPPWAPATLFRAGGGDQESEITLGARLHRGFRRQRRQWRSESARALDWLGRYLNRSGED